MYPTEVYQPKSEPEIRYLPPEFPVTSSYAVAGVNVAIFSLVFSLAPFMFIAALFSFYLALKGSRETVRGYRGGHGISVTALFLSVLSMIPTAVFSSLWILVMVGGAKFTFTGFHTT